MTQVAFHFNAPDKLAYVCRLVRKATRQDARVTVTGDADTLLRLDRQLWALAPSDFVGHCLGDADEEILRASPTVLVQDPRTSPNRDVLINLGNVLPEGFAQYARVVEVVSQADEDDRKRARERWRGYAALGYDIVRHDLVLKESAG